MQTRKVPLIALVSPLLLATLACVAPPGSAGPVVAVDERSPQEQICAALVETQLADTLDDETRAAAQAQLDAAVEGCVADLDDAYEQSSRQRGRAVECLLAATDAEGVTACSEPDPEAVCEHVLTVVMAELSAQMPEDQRGQLTEAFEQGKTECAEQGRRELEENRERYLLTAGCFMESETVAALQACDQAAGPPPEIATEGNAVPMEPPPEAFPDAPPPLDETGYEDPAPPTPAPAGEGDAPPKAPKAPPKAPKGQTPPAEPVETP